MRKFPGLQLPDCAFSVSSFSTAPRLPHPIAAPPRHPFALLMSPSQQGASTVTVSHISVVESATEDLYSLGRG